MISQVTHVPASGKRCDPRYELTPYIAHQVILNNGSRGLRHLSGQAINLSSRGLKTYLPGLSASLFSQILGGIPSIGICFTKPSNHESITLCGSVAWVSHPKPIRPQQGNNCYLGISFAEHDQEGIAEYEHFIQTLCPELRWAEAPVAAIRSSVLPGMLRTAARGWEIIARQPSVR